MSYKKKPEMAHYQLTLERVSLVDRSLRLWEDYLKGVITKNQYYVMQEATLKAIRELKEVEKNGEKS